jgi:uncharacterized protein involved in outer membrane biogenesis
MRTFFRWAFRITVTLVFLLIVLLVVGVLLKDTIAKSLAERNMRDNTGLDAKIEKMEVGLMTPTVNLEGLKLYNNPDFGGGTFLEMPELRMEYVPDDIRDGKLHLKTVRLHIAEVHIVKSKDGRTNFEEVQKETRKKARSQKEKTDKPGVDFGGIDTLYLTVDKLRITDLRDRKNDREINVGIKDEVGRNLKTEEQITGWFALVVFRLYLQQAMTNPAAQDNLRTLLEGPKKPKRNR